MASLGISDAIWQHGLYYVHGYKCKYGRTGYAVITGKRPSRSRHRLATPTYLANRHFTDLAEATNYFNAQREVVKDLALAEAEKASKKKADRSSALAAYKASSPCPWKEGDMCHTSWGYDQTNVEAYQFIKILSRTRALVRRVGGELEQNGPGADRFRPIKNRFTGPPQTVQAGFSVYAEGVSESWNDPKYGYGLYPTKEGESHYVSSNH